MTRKTYKTIKGRQGDWLCEVTFSDGSVELIPTAEKARLHGTHYHNRSDGPVSMKRFPGKLASWKAALLATNKVVLAESQGELGQETIRREKYIGVYDVANVKLIGEVEHSFDLVGRYYGTQR